MSLSESLLSPDEGEPVAVESADGQGLFVFVCEHASLRLPRALGDLGLSAEALTSHIAWDPGALEIARMLSTRFDSPLVSQRFSRLAYDCNRPPESPAAMPETSEIYHIPGNEKLSPEAREKRINGLYQPFHAAVSALLDRRAAAGLPTVVVTVHTFTPVYFGASRSVEIGILHDEDTRLADAMLEGVSQAGKYDVRRNEPYGPADGVTHSLRLHGLPRGLQNVMIEVRNDLVRDAAGQAAVAEYLAALFGNATHGGHKKKPMGMVAAQFTGTRN